MTRARCTCRHPGLHVRRTVDSLVSGESHCARIRSGFWPVKSYMHDDAGSSSIGDRREQLAGSGGRVGARLDQAEQSGYGVAFDRTKRWHNPRDGRLLARRCKSRHPTLGGHSIANWVPAALRRLWKSRPRTARCPDDQGAGAFSSDHPAG